MFGRCLVGELFGMGRLMRLQLSVPDGETVTSLAEPKMTNPSPCQGGRGVGGGVVRGNPEPWNPDANRHL